MTFESENDLAAKVSSAVGPKGRMIKSSKIGRYRFLRTHRTVRHVDSDDARAEDGLPIDHARRKVQVVLDELHRLGNEVSDPGHDRVFDSGAVIAERMGSDV